MSMRPSKAMFPGLAAAVALLVSACGGGGAGGTGGVGVNPGLPTEPDTPSSLEGAWAGSFAIGADQGDARLLVLPGGGYWLLYGGPVGSGFAVSGFVQGAGVSAGGQFSSADARDFFGIAPVAAGTLAASFTSQAIDGNATFPDWTMAFAVAPVPTTTYDFKASAALADIAGLWSMHLIDGTPVDVTIQTDGSLSGVESTTLVGSRCQFTGTATPRAGVNVFDIVLSFGPAPCTLPGQVVGGIGYTYTIAGTAVREFLVAGVNGIRGRGTALYGVR